MDWSNYITFDKLFPDLGKKPLTAETRALLSLSEMTDDFSLLLSNYRYDHSLTQKQLADQLGISQAMVSSYESGSRNFSVKTLCGIAAQLGYAVSLVFHPLTPVQVAMGDGLDKDMPDLSLAA